MNRATFDFVDKTLAQYRGKDYRHVALELLKAGERVNRLDNAVLVIMRSFLLGEKAVKLWYRGKVKV